MKQVLIFGRRQQGKSTLAAHLALESQGGVAVYDVNAQFGRWPDSTTSDLGLFANWVDGSPARVLVYRPARDVWGEFEGFAEILWRKRGFTLLVDEASQLQTYAGAHPGLDRFVRMASPRDVSVIQTMHRPRDSAGICRSLATDWYFFRTTLDRDLAVIEEHCSAECAATVKGFAEGSHEVLHWSDAFARVAIIDRPESWYEDLHGKPRNGTDERSRFAVNSVGNSRIEH